MTNALQNLPPEMQERLAQIMAGQNAADLAEVARWSSLLEAGRDPNVILIPCLFCGDDVATTQNTRFTD